MVRCSPARTQSKPPGQWWIRYSKRTTAFVLTGAELGGRKRLTRSSIPTEDGTTSKPRWLPHVECMGAGELPQRRGCDAFGWLRGMDLNHRPLGYERAER